MEEVANTSSCEVKPLTEEETSILKKCTNDAYFDWFRVGAHRYILPSFWMEHAEEIRKLPLRETDTWVVTFPRSGTTWTQELVWLVKNDLNFEQAKTVPLIERYQMLELFLPFRVFEKCSVKDSDDEKTINAAAALTAAVTPRYMNLAKSPSPRYIKSHLPFSLLPVNTLDTCKAVYVARDPRDVAVSTYHYYKDMKVLRCEFKEFFDMFIQDLWFRTPLFEHVKEAWLQRHHPNMLFLFYEELSKDLKNTTKRVADFFGKTFTDDQFDQLCEHLSFKNFQSNKSVSHMQFVVDAGLYPSQGFSEMFVRRGKVGGWRDYFDAEMTARAQAWMQHNLQDTDLRFPLSEL